MEFQQHQEALGACLATEAEIQEVDLDGSVLLYQNDVEAAMSALSKGSLSFRSAEMQLCAMLPARTHTTHHMDWPLIPRASLALVQEGIDWALQGGGAWGRSSWTDCWDWRQVIGSGGWSRPRWRKQGGK